MLEKRPSKRKPNKEIEDIWGHSRGNPSNVRFRSIPLVFFHQCGSWYLSGLNERLDIETIVAVSIDIGSMVLLYIVLHGSHPYTPVLLAFFYQHHGSVMALIPHDISTTWAPTRLLDDSAMAAFDNCWPLVMTHIAMEAMAHRNRWFTWVFLWKMVDLSMANC